MVILLSGFSESIPVLSKEISSLLRHVRWTTLCPLSTMLVIKTLSVRFHGTNNFFFETGSLVSLMSLGGTSNS